MSLFLYIQFMNSSVFFNIEFTGYAYLTTSPNGKIDSATIHNTNL